MVDMWVTHPGGERWLPEVRELAGKLQGEIAEITSLGDEGTCRLCGNRAALTKEHAPSKKAGNPLRAIQVMIDHGKSLASSHVVWKAHRVQGAKAEALCRQCNNNTGTWYNPAYIRFAQLCEKLAQEENAGKTCDVEIEIHP